AIDADIGGLLGGLGIECLMHGQLSWKQPMRISYTHMGAEARQDNPLTANPGWLFVIGVPGVEAPGPVELFNEQDAHQGMGQGEWREGPGLVGPGETGGGEAIGAADQQVVVFPALLPG